MTETPKRVLPPSMISTPISPSKYPEIIFEKKIIYVTDILDFTITCVEILYEIDSEAYGDQTVAIGFDAEWPFTPQTGTGKLALIQFCLDENTCYLFHVYNYQTLPESFIKILKHPKVKLAGLNIANDVRKLGRDFHFDISYILAENCVDVGRLACSVLKIKECWSLQRLVRFLFKRNLNKDTEVRWSDWKNTELSESQKTYAATDAYVSLLCFQELINTKSPQC